MYWHYFQNLTHTSDNGFFLPSINTATRFRKHIAISFRQILLEFGAKFNFDTFTKRKIFTKHIFFLQVLSALTAISPRTRSVWAGWRWGRAEAASWARAPMVPMLAMVPWPTPASGGAACSPDSATTAGKHSQTASTSSNTSSMFTFSRRESTATSATKLSRTNGISGNTWSLLTELLWNAPKMQKTPTV